MLITINRLLLVCALLVVHSASYAAQNPTPAPTPSPDLSPRDVVAIQLLALQNNDETDSGLALVFRFAAPVNKQATGPFERFTQIMKAGMYRPLIHARSVEFGEQMNSGDRAAQVVSVTDIVGARHDYLFVLRKQPNGEDKGCWLTESVFSRPSARKPPRQLRL